MEVTTSIGRVLDANLNRLKEGLRVCEDIFRYSYDEKKLASSIKSVRHNARLSFDVIEHRNIEGDVLKSTTASEKIRQDIEHVVVANFKRALESARVLEEILKLVDTKEAEKFKQIRYTLYAIEKEAMLYLHTS